MNENGLTPEQKAKMRERLVEAAKAELKGIKGREIRRRHSRGDDRD
jgi:hypothetical protein